MKEKCRIEFDSELNNVDVEAKLKILKEQFLAQANGVFAGNNSSTDKPNPFEAEDIDLVLRSHLVGSRARAKNLFSMKLEDRPFRMGSYTVQIGSSLTKFLCIDIDGGSKHKFPLQNPDEVAIDLFQRAEAFGLNPYLEKSKSGAGWHLWIFFDQPTGAMKARKLGFLICKQEYELVGGGVSNVKSGKGLEVFPKQDFVEVGSYGNLVWLPWYFKADGGGNQFYKCLKEELC